MGFQIESVSVHGYAIPFYDNNSIYANVNIHLKGGTPQKVKEREGFDSGGLAFSFNNGPLGKLYKRASYKDQNIVDINSPEYYALINGFLDIVESVTSITEHLVEQSKPKFK